MRDFGDAWFRVFMDNCPTTAFVKDEVGRLLYVNPTFVKAFGFEERDWQGKTDLELWPPDTAEALRENDVRILESGSPEAVEEVVRHADGEHTWITVKFPFRDGDGRRYLAGMGMDVTEQRRLEQIASRAAHMESIGQLAGGVAHDFNNLLMVILGSCEAAESDRDRDPGRLAERLASIRLAATRGGELVQRLLGFARRQVMKTQLVDVNELLGAMEAILRGLLPADLEYRFEPGAGLGPVRVDTAQLEQILVNLVANARDALPAGGAVTVRSRRHLLAPGRQSHASALPAGAYVTIEVVDTGSGIDPAILHRIFDPFFTTKQFGEGAGLGLATAHGLLRQNGGDITVESEPGKGSRFLLWLREQEGEPEELGDLAGAVAQPGNREVILVAEDDPSVRQVVVAALESARYSVIAAGSGQEAIELVSQHDGAIDLLLTDVVMPGMGGPKLATAVQSLRPGTPVLYMSGYTAEALTHRGELLEGIELLPKPFHVHELLGRVAAMLHARES